MANKKDDKKPTQSDADDSLRLKVLVVGTDKKSIADAATFLIRRGWEAQSTTRIKDALLNMASFRPNFVLMSVNLNSPKINRLPSTIFQTFKTPVITFSENSDTRSMMLMNSVPSNFKLAGQMTGTSAERRIRQILNELQSAEDQNSKEIAARLRQEEESSGAKAGSFVQARPEDIERLANEFGRDPAEEQPVEKQPLELKKQIPAGFDDFFKQAAAEVDRKYPPASREESFKHCVVLPLELDDRVGFLVLHRNEAAKDQVSWTRQFQERTAERVTEKNIVRFRQLIFGEPIDVEIGQMDLGEHVDGEEFTAKTKDTILKFFWADNIAPTVEAVESTDKAQIRVGELGTQAAIGVDVYLHLPKNKRFYLYLKKQSKLSEKQKMRLTSRDMNLFINNEDLPNYKTNHVRARAVEMLVELKNRIKKTG